MAYIDWQDSFSVNVKELDDDHKELILAINTLHHALMENKMREAQKQTIDKMIAYAADHFAAEEKYMLQFHVPGYEKHKAEHDQFTAKALELQGRMDKAGLVLSLEILGFLKDWLHDHILVVDKEYTEHFNKAGLS